MKIRNSISTVVGFKAVSTTALLVLVYTVIFTLVIVTDELPDVPKNTRGLDLDQANADLHQVRTSIHT